MDAGDEFEKGALARPVSADETDCLAMIDAQRHVLERPELLDRLSVLTMQEPKEPHLQIRRSVVRQQKLLGNRLRVDDRHYNCSVNCGSNATNSREPTTNAPNACMNAIAHTAGSGHWR